MYVWMEVECCNIKVVGSELDECGDQRMNDNSTNESHGTQSIIAAMMTINTELLAFDDWGG
jgi:hypothetical protein